jgi:hypothetical protein
LKRIKIIVTNGDSQEIGQLDDAINPFFPNAYRIRCSWHIIDRGWHKKVKVALRGKSHKKRALASFDKPRQKAAPLTELIKTARTIYRWMFSWAQPLYCKTEEAYFLSKALFMKFVASRQVREVLGLGVGNAIIKFARESVILFHLETHTNCGHEGTNNGMKHCATPVMPQNCLDRAVQTLHLNATMKAGNKSIDVCHKSNSKKSWSDSPTSQYGTDPCESMLQTEWRLSTTWTPHRVSQYRWLLIHSANEACSDESSEDDESDEESDDEYSDESSEVGGKDEAGDKDEAGLASKKLTANAFGPIPRFSRVYEIAVEQASQVFSCTCCH